MNPRRSLRWVVAGQFIGALADNALLLVALAILLERHAPAWNAPALRMVFYLSYVLLSAFAGAIADAWPKKRMLVAINLLKVGGCAVLLTGATPLLAYALIGIGAATHAPARYGILSEFTPEGELLAANAWMEIATVLALLMGTVWGSLLLQGGWGLALPAYGIASNAALTLGAAYVLAALCALPVRAAAASSPRALARPAALVREFAHSARTLWRDPVARVSLTATCVFWAAAAVLQFVILRWSVEQLGLTLAQAGLMQGAVAAGTIAGAAAAGKWIREDRALQTWPLGLALAAAVASMAAVASVPVAAALMLAVGAMSGLLLVPMNTVLQRRGLALMHPGQSIAVQNFSENLASLLALAAYGATRLQR
ncbi:lysophospholipid transporter LplT [Caenimonas aquaedulcis]|uniref:Lysophospholipid transporter LplT n=1 Tax=Caenimonas aquaedulcis TaxID=2793270 RepID=A0A931MHA0_9BURK|nr:lysophospholipid transporter LplT [Caenimonas aquaedulcis]MBG9388668.1 lysophospholipid transporter LplT [Caenimonas aquaedulcis]